MALDEADLDALVTEAAAILDAAAKPFIAGHRADSAVQKKGNDFATEVDLAIERQVVEALTSNTGIEVHGEEFGGADIDSPLGGIVTGLAGNDWTTRSRSALVGLPGVHGELLELLHSVGAPEDY